MPIRIHTLCLDLQKPVVYSFQVNLVGILGYICGCHLEYVTHRNTVTQCLLSGKLWRLVTKLHFQWSSETSSSFRTGILIVLLVLFVMYKKHEIQLPYDVKFHLNFLAHRWQQSDEWPSSQSDSHWNRQSSSWTRSTQSKSAGCLAGNEPWVSS